MTRTIPLCLSLVFYLGAGPLSLNWPVAWADEPVTTPEIEFLPAETIKLHEFESDTIGPYDKRMLGEYRRGADQVPLWCDFNGKIVDRRSLENHRMDCEIEMNASMFYLAGKRPIPSGLLQRPFVSYGFRQGHIYPLLFGELYRIEDLTRSDDRGKYALLKRVTRKELGIDAPLEYSRLYIPIQSQERGHESGGRGPLSCRFWYAEEPNRYTEKLETVLKCRLNYPKVIPSDEELFPVLGPMTVAEGNILPVVDCGFKILRIVPPNVEKKVCGWVEIDPYPVALRTPLGRELEKLEQREKLDQHKLPPQPPLAPQPEPQR